MHHAFKFLYLISKVRGAKVVVRWFSHEVSDLQPVLQLLQKQDMKDHEVTDCISWWENSSYESTVDSSYLDEVIVNLLYTNCVS